MGHPQLARDTDREQITDLLLQVRGGSPEAMDRLCRSVYGELRRIASCHPRGEWPNDVYSASLPSFTMTLPSASTVALRSGTTQPPPAAGFAPPSPRFGPKPRETRPAAFSICGP